MDYEEYLKDQLNDGLGCDYNKMEKYCEDIVKRLNIESQQNILDIGCREFHTFAYFKSKFGFEIIGGDIGIQGHKYARELGRPSIYVDAHKMDIFNTGYFDVLLAIHSLEHMLNLEVVIEECARILRSGGMFYIAVPFPSHDLHKGHYQEITDENEFSSRFTEYFNIIEKIVTVPGDERNIRGEGELFLILERK